MPVISVIMPLYNANEYLREALDSIINQTFRDWELLAINEPDSNDGTAETMREYEAKDSRIKLIQNESRLGISASLNIGLRLAKGEFIARMDADDTSLPSRFERQLAFLQGNPDIDICGVKPQMLGTTWDWQIETDPDYLRSDCLFFTPFVHPTVMMRTARLREFGLEYNPDYPYTEDYELFTRASTHLRFGNILESLFKYRWHDKNATLAGGDYGKKLYRDIASNMISQAGVSISEAEADLLCVHTCPNPETAQQALDCFCRLDLLLKRIYFCQTARKLYGTYALYHTMWRRWKDAFEKVGYKSGVISDTRVEAMHRRGFFHNPAPYRLGSDLHLGDVPKVSIVLPAFNSEGYIADTLRSLFEQTFTDFEILLINDFGSNDDTLKIATSFEDPRLRILQKEAKRGLAESLNLGIREARGKYIARADADDLYPPQRLQKQVDFMDAHPKIAVCGSWQHHFGRYDAVHKPLETHEELKANLIFTCDVCHSTLMLRKSEFIDNELWYDGNYLSEDYELWTRAVHKIKFHTLQEVLGEYRVWDGSITAGKAESLDTEARRLVARTLREHLRIKLPEKDLILLSGWTNPFVDSNRPDRKELISQEKALFQRIHKQNTVLKVYEPSALEQTLDQRTRWMNGQCTSVEVIHNNGIKHRLRSFVRRILRLVYKPVYNRCIAPIINLLTELTWKTDSRIWKAEKYITQAVDARIFEAEEQLRDHSAIQTALVEQTLRQMEEHLMQMETLFHKQILESRKNDLQEILSVLDGRIWKTEQNNAQMFQEYKLQTENSTKCKYLLVNDTFNTFHHGSTATSIAIKNHLGDDVNSIPYSLIFSPRVSPSSLREFLSCEFAMRWERENDWLIKKVQLCEEVVINGEGSLARYAAGTLNDLYFAYYCGTKLHKKVHIINHSIFTSNYADELSPDEAEDFAAMIRLAYLAATSCYFREPESLAQLDPLIPGKGKLSFDCLCLYIREIYDKSRIAKCARERIVISGGNFLWAWYVSFLKELLSVLPAELSTMPITFLISDVPYSDLSGDTQLFDDIAASLGREVEKIIVRTTDEWLDVIGTAALFISGRFHHSIASFMLDTPFLAFKTDTKKMEGMLQVIEKTENLLCENTVKAIEQADMLLRKPDFFKANDELIKDKIVNLALNNFEYQ